MKLHLVSDLHLEHSDIILTGGEVLIIAGDTCESRNLKPEKYELDYVVDDERPHLRSDRYARFFIEECAKYDQVIMVAGNHEYYGSKLHKTVPHFKEHLPDNVHILENETFEYDGKLFVGATLWTDQNRADPITAFDIGLAMKDYQKITEHLPDYGVYRKLRTTTTLSMHRKSKHYIKTVATDYPDKDIIVVTHHAPSFESCDPMYANDTKINGAYMSDLSDMILDNQNITHWFHGHIHSDSDYHIGNTRVICHPRGYFGYEISANNYSPKEIIV